eukprot:6482577-Amphidinium_carterae.1
MGPCYIWVTHQEHCWGRVPGFSGFLVVTATSIQKAQVRNENQMLPTCPIFESQMLPTCPIFEWVKKIPFEPRAHIVMFLK